MNVGDTQNATEYSPSDNALMEQVIKTLVLTKPSGSFVKVSLQKKSESEISFDLKEFTLLKSMLEFSIPADFNLSPKADWYIKNNELWSSYPGSGSHFFPCYGNYNYPDPSDSDKIIREKTPGAIEICMHGLDFIPSDTQFETLGMNKITPVKLMDDGNRVSAFVEVKVKPTEKNANTEIIAIGVRSGDVSQKELVIDILNVIISSLQVK
jgi:hypothetical protein